MKKFYGLLILTFTSFLSTSIAAQSNTIEQAEIFIKQGNYLKAISLLNNHISINPYDDRAYIMRAWSHGILGHQNKKQQDLDYAEHLNPLVYMYVNESIRSSLYEKKLFDYDFTFISEDFSKSPVQLEYYKEYADNKSNANLLDSNMTSAIQYLSNFQLNEADKYITKIGSNSKNSNIYFDLKGIAELKKNQLINAIKYFSESIETSPDYAMAYHNRSIAHMMNGNYNQAEKDLLKAISLEDNIAIYYFTMAKLKEKMGDTEAAKNNYEKATILDPTYIEAKTNLMLLQKVDGDYKESLMELTDILNTYSLDAEYHYIKGGLDLTYGLYEEAISEFESFLLSNPEDPSAMFNLGLSKYLNHQRAEGCAEIEESVKISGSLRKMKIYDKICESISID